MNDTQDDRASPDRHQRPKEGSNLTQVRWFDRGLNMRRVWDSGIIERADETEDFWLADLAELDVPENRSASMKGTVAEWATELLLAARKAYQDPRTGTPTKSGTKLADEYQQMNLPVARRRMAQAALRLAWVLNEAFTEN
jgi:hypothetical protein